MTDTTGLMVAAEMEFNEGEVLGRKEDKPA
jgi:hypothetical protein